MVVLVLGAVHALSFAPGPLPGWTLPYVQVFSLAALFHRLFRSDTHWQAAGYAFLFGVSNFTLGLYWLFISMHKYGGLTWPLQHWVCSFWHVFWRFTPCWPPCWRGTLARGVSTAPHLRCPHNY